MRGRDQIVDTTTTQAGDIYRYRNTIPAGTRDDPENGDNAIKNVRTIYRRAEKRRRPHANRLWSICITDRKRNVKQHRRLSPVKIAPSFRWTASNSRGYVRPDDRYHDGVPAVPVIICWPSSRNGPKKHVVKLPVRQKQNGPRTKNE